VTMGSALHLLKATEMKSEYKVRQHDEQDCAVACIASVARFYGLKTPLVTIRDACGAGREGTTLKGIVEGFGKLGIDAKPYKSPDKAVEMLCHAGMPIILHTARKDGGLHFVVLYRMTGGKAFIMDPADGDFRTMKAEELKKIWSGYLVCMKPKPDFRKGDFTVSPLARFWKVIAANGKDLSLALAGAMTFIILSISTSIFLQLIIDKVLPSGDGRPLALIAGAMALIAALSLYIGYGRVMYLLRTGVRIDSELIMSYMEHLFRLPVSFFASRKAGELNSRINDAFKIRSFVSDSLMSIIISAFTLAASIALMFTYQWRLALAVLAFMPAYCLIYLGADKANRKYQREMKENAAAFQALSVEAIGGIREVKHFSSESFYAGRIERRYAELAGSVFSGGKAMGAFGTASEGLNRAMTLVIIIVGSSFIFKGSMTAGELVSFYSLAAFFSGPLSQLVDLNGRLNDARTSAERLFEIMDAEAEEDEGGFEAICLDKAEDICIEGLCFSYPGRPVLFEGLSIEIPAGSVTAVTGDSGCGKSTLAALIMRDYRPQKGTIYIRGIDVSQISLKKWRKYAAMVPQNSGILSGTLLECMTCNEREPDLERVAVICAELGLKDFIVSLPSGLLSTVGENGCTLSGGQMQRLALARALYRQPKMLLLDEATSSLDSESERIILEKVKEFADEGGTVVMITHKKDNLKIASKTISLSEHSKGGFYTPETVVKI
jgi:ABC-type bacteriocin/lantibiotic exporter with double-glycine peptidase domain